MKSGYVIVRAVVDKYRGKNVPVAVVCFSGYDAGFWAASERRWPKGVKEHFQQPLVRVAEEWNDRRKRNLRARPPRQHFEMCRDMKDWIPDDFVVTGPFTMPPNASHDMFYTGKMLYEEIVQS